MAGDRIDHHQNLGTVSRAVICDSTLAAKVTRQRAALQDVVLSRPHCHCVLWMGVCLSDVGLALHHDRIIDATHRCSGFLHLGEVERYMAVQPKPGEFMMGNICRGSSLSKELSGAIRSLEVAGLLLACVLILAEGSSGSSGQAGTSQVAVHSDGLSVVVQPD